MVIHAMENPRGLTTPPGSRGSDGPSEPAGLNERNEFEPEILRADAPKPDDELDVAAAETGADNTGENDTGANDSDSSFEDPDIRSRRPDVYNGGVSNSAYNPYVHSGEIVRSARHGPDGRPLFAWVTRLYERRSMIYYPRSLFTGKRGVKRGVVTEQVSNTIMVRGGFFSKTLRTKTQPYYDEREIYFIQERTMCSYWRRNRVGTTPPPDVVRKVKIPALPM
ncbi:hypothetical protein CFAM422_006507 [Trichoderma lentiforme]|uniref:Uncharacterized protein n=1 Tax=Trichoderma lentiforme TaxID=1567552 RepID=A0A9P5CBT0_9HYPO|nr:hypothetical protein CFAM422_006507 [Trichoderma lentiforme]